MVAGLEGGDAGADLHDDAGTLMATDEREELRAHEIEEILGRHHVAGDEVLVGVAHSCHLPVDEDLVRLRRVDGDLLDLPGLVDSPEDCCT